MHPTNVDLLEGERATSGWEHWAAGRGAFSVDCADFNGATIKLQMKGPNGSAIDVGTDVTFTATGAGGFMLPSCEIRCAVITAVPGAGVYARAARIGTE